MCITTIKRDNAKCLVNNTINDMVLDYFDHMWPYWDFNCTDFDSNILITELDTNNVVHYLNLNFTGNISDLNYSMIYFPNSIWIIRPAWEVALTTLIFLPVIVGGLFSNLMLFNVVAHNMCIQTPTNILITIMALVDFVTILLCPWMYLVHHFFQNYVLGSIGCKMEGFLSASLLVMNVMFLSVISCDRLMAIVLPREARLTKNGSIKLSFLIFCLSIVLALPLCIYRTYKVRRWKNFTESYCSENLSILPIYWHVLLSTLVLFPISVMVICYSAIFWKLDKYEKENLRREHPITVNRKMKIARTILILVFAFIICRLPFTICVFWRNKLLREAQVNSVTTGFYILWLFSHYLIYVNCAINPMIYGLTNENYKKALSSTLIYRWLSGNSKNISNRENLPNEYNNKINIAKKENCNINYENLYDKKKSKIAFDNPVIFSLSSSAQIKPEQVICNKINPLTEDHIFN